jgi:hypothetical protein
MSRSVELFLPAPPCRRIARILLACWFSLAMAAAGGAAAQQPADDPAPAEPPPSAEAVTVEHPLPMDTIVVRASPEPPPAASRPPQTISLSLREADLVEVLRSFAVLGGFNLVIDPAVKGTVTVELKDVRWELALAVILRTHGLAAEIDGTVVSLRPLPVAGR